MDISVVGIVIGGAVMMIWGFLCLYGRRCERRRQRRGQRWQARWNEFASRQSGLDAELNRAWDRLKR